jgi:hypothetical protein
MFFTTEMFASAYDTLLTVYDGVGSLDCCLYVMTFFKLQFPKEF